jgi:lipopolysaccharide/colanic/teichoic acid biosynthesis glycosyltransferase
MMYDSLFTNIRLRCFALILFVLTLPLFVIISVLIKLNSKGPIIFKQKRVGKNKKIFTMYKFRTMVNGAEKLQSRYQSLNQADGPAFKIYDDPRFTSVGKVLSLTGLNELPQLLNVIKGEMDFVGPRPLPIQESKKIPQKYHKRFLVLPGLTSLWVIRGAHELSFKEWMESDVWYVTHKSVKRDILTILKTVYILFYFNIRSIILWVTKRRVFVHIVSLFNKVEFHSQIDNVDNSPGYLDIEKDKNLLVPFVWREEK